MNITVSVFNFIREAAHFGAAVMKWSTDSVKENKITDMILSLKNTEKQLRVVHLPPDCLLLLLDGLENLRR